MPIIKENIENKEIIEKIRNLNLQHYCMASKEAENNKTESCYSISNILEKKETDFSTFLLQDKILEKYAWAMDIVYPSSNHSCCFTKAYGHYVVGTGSILSTEHPETVAKVFEHIKTLDHDSENSLKSLKSLNLRYFTPNEILRLMCFPFDFIFPQNVTLKQKYRLLGNSINVHVVSVLIVLLTYDDSK